VRLAFVYYSTKIKREFSSVIAILACQDLNA
jgi:hypothetical protein